MKTRRARFVVFQGLDGQWYWRLQSPNGRTVAQSEGYTRRDGARQGVRAVVRLVPQAGIQVLKPQKAEPPGGGRLPGGSMDAAHA